MPADYTSTAQALPLPAISTRTAAGEQDSPSDPVPPWAPPQRPPTNSHRLSTPYPRATTTTTATTAEPTSETRTPLGRRIWRTSTALLNASLEVFTRRLSPLQRVAAVAGGTALLTVLVLFLHYSHRIFARLAPVAQGWRSLPAGWLIIWFLTFGAAFPPVMGYSTVLTLSGFVYGVGGGWPIVASATVAGSTCAFFTSRTVFSRYVDSLVGTDRRFVALGQVLRHDGLLVLAAIRFCPLPYSLSNGFLATIPSIRPLSFALATAMATPKLLGHVFIGSRLAALAESGEKMSARDRAFNYLGIAAGLLVGGGLGWVIFRRTMARASELSRADAGEAGGLVDPDDFDELESGSPPLDGRLGEADGLDLMDPDDISLWEADGAVGSAYSDERDSDNSPTRSQGDRKGNKR